VGAVLGAVLTLAASNPGQSFILLLSYTMGLGVPFLVVGLFTDRADRLIQRYAGALVWINRIFGVFLILIGMLIFTGQLSLLANLSILNSILLAR
jgi:cytochrome c-type biogenesis protein